MKLIKAHPYARLTPKVETLFNKACKLEAKWGRIISGIGKKGDALPAIPMKRHMKSAASIQRQLNKLGFGIKD